MPFSPEEISSKHFVVTLRGYDRAEVDAYLRAVASDQTRLLRRISELESPSGRSEGPVEAGDGDLARLLDDALRAMTELRRRLPAAAAASPTKATKATKVTKAGGPAKAAPTNKATAAPRATAAPKSTAAAKATKATKATKAAKADRAAPANRATAAPKATKAAEAAPATRAATARRATKVTKAGGAARASGRTPSRNGAVPAAGAAHAGTRGDSSTVG